MIRVNQFCLFVRHSGKRSASRIRILESLTLPRMTLVLFLISYFLSLISPVVYAQSLQDSLDDKYEQIQEAEAQLEESQHAQKSLKLELAALDGQEALIALKIEAVNLQKKQLEEELQDSAKQNKRLKANLDTLSRELEKKIASSDGIPVWDLLFPWEGFGKIGERYKKLQKDREESTKLLSQVENAKHFYEKQEDIRRQKVTQTNELAKQLETFTLEFDEQKKAKQELLIITRNDEATYQKLIADLQEEAEAIDKAASNLSRVVGTVNRGDQIGSVGLTGCTSGAHLHFETYENARVENSKVIGTRVNPRKLLNTGIVGSPLLQFPGARVSAEYGIRYALGRHTGIDIVVPIGTSVLASGNGTTYAISGPGCKIKGFDHGESKGIVIDHGNGYVSLYWHLQ